ncbi:hypothetical protein GCM10023169_25510 [Georgenia halophila]|uniref:Extracellular solute-binding protein n=1 Tax=Georgenia halophila TaxID=620889 RepID=A0ABP8LCV1_9MICO
MLRINFEQQPHFEAVVEEFRRQNPDVQVEVTNSPLTFENGSVQSHLRSGEGADVLLVNSGPARVGMLSEAGLVANLDDTFAEYDITERYSEDVIAQTTAPDGSVYEVVEGRDIFQLYYHADVLEAAGVKPPETWDELVASCKPLAESGVTPLVVGARNHFAGGWLLGTLVQSAAGQDVMRDVLFGDGAFTQEPIVEGAEKVTELIDNGCINGEDALALDHDQAGVAFDEKAGAMMVGTQATIPGREEDGYDTGSIEVTPMPSNRPEYEHPTSGLALSWVVNAETQVMPAAQKWLEWVSSEEYLSLAVEHNTPWAPARLVEDTGGFHPAIAQAVEAVERGTGYNPSVYLPGTSAEAWYAAVQGLLAQNSDAATLMGDIEQELSSNRDAE